MDMNFCVAGLAPGLASHIAATPANACGAPCAAGTAPLAAAPLAAAAHLGADSDARSSMIIPPIFPSAGFIRNASPEEEARAQEIVNQFLAQISPHAATASIAPSKCASNIKICQRHQNSAKFFSATITVTPNEAFKGDRCCRIESVTSELEKYVQKSTIEGVLVQSVKDECLTLSCAMLFSASHNGTRLQYNLRELHLACFEGRRDSVVVKCAVTTPC